MTAITSAGAGSGLPLEDIISASLNARRTQFEKQVVTRESNLKTSLSGIGQLKSAISDFITAAKKLSEAGAFNLRTVNITQPEDNPVLKVESKSATSNGNYNIVVSQLAGGSRYESVPSAFSSAEQVVATAEGQLTFSAGADKSFTVDVAAGETLQSLRKRINENADNFGVTANIINLNGESRLVLESGVTGAGNELQIAASTAELKIFDTTDVASKLSLKTAAQDAAVTIDGVAVTSSSNRFDDVVQDLSITVLRESDKDASNDPIANKVSVTTDTQGVRDKIDGFIKAYNTLHDRMDSLGKRASIVAGERQDDAGPLAGDSTLKSIENFLFQTLSTPSTDGGPYGTVYEMGFKQDNKGKLSVDSAKFNEVMDKNFEQVGALLGGDKGVAAKLVTELENYTKTGGSLAKREDSLNIDMRAIRDKRSSFEASMVTYESALRRQYGNLDTMLVKMNQSAQSLSLLLTQ